MAVRKLKKRIVGVSVVSLLALLVAALPLWFPWALRPLAKRYGATYARYRRVGYQRFELSDLNFTNGTVHLQAAEVRAFVPTVWLWRHLTGGQSEEFLTVRSWQYAPVESKSSVGSNAPVSVRNDFANLQKTAATLRNWLPTAKLTNGTVRLGREVVQINGVTWSNGNLASVISASNVPPLTVTVSTKPRAPWTVNIACEPQSFHSTLSLADRDEHLAITGTADWLTNHTELSADFPSHGFIPEAARLRAASIAVPARYLSVPEYGTFHGSLEGAWQTNHFNIQLAANAAPSGTNLPPLDIQLRVSGDTNAAQLEVAKISSPSLQADLSAPAPIRFHAPFLSQPATLNITANLDKQHWFTAEGQLTGKAVVSAGEPFPSVSFTLAGSRIRTTSITASNLAVDGSLKWPVLNLKTVQAVMDDSSHIALAGEYNFTNKTVRGGRLDSSGPFGGQFLPADYGFETASVSARFGGPLTVLTNSAIAQIKQFVTPSLQPVDINARWNNEGLNIKSLEATITAGASSLQLGGSAQLAPGHESAELTAFELSQSNHTELRLDRPAKVAFQILSNAPSAKTPSTTNSTWTVNIEPLDLKGDMEEFHLAATVDWPQRGALECEARGLDARLLKDFIPQANSDAVLNRFHFSGGWTNGPVAFQLTSDATLRTREEIPFSAAAKITGGQAGIAIEQLSVSSATQDVCRAEGALPVLFDPTRKDGMLQINADAPLKLQMLTDPKSVLWKKLAEATGLRLEEPQLVANLEGTWTAPKGQVTLRVARIELKRSSRPLPAIENVDLLAVLNRATARLERLNFDVEKQPVTITGEIPLGENFWSNLRHKRSLPDWKQATAQLKIENAQVAPFAPLLPQILSAEGTASADISLKPGGNVQGELSITNARTHPLESIGPVRNINLLARLDGQQLKLENSSAEIGGQRVNVDGALQLDYAVLWTNGVPPFVVRVSGTNVPLARNPSVLLRANLDLTATNSGSEVPLVYGNVKLRDSLLLSDLRALVPERTSSARRRPPYFSVDVEPWAQWRLKVNVTGDSFVRVQTPLFHGTVSTVMTLQGTLKDPLALGQVKIDPGSFVSFPFSSLDVKQGFISLTSEDPYRPTLFVTAESRRYGYDVKMEATGPVDQPVVKFSSVPGLSSEEIVLMLTAGQIPRGLGVTATTQQRAQGLAIFVGKNLLSDFGLGGGGQERLTIRSGEDISESGRPTYDIEYKLTDRWSVIGEYDRFDQYNLNVKYKLYSK